jgi:hypothetical protein
LWWARKLDTAVNMILASEVPKARCISMASGMPWRTKQNISMGTMTRPPPIPSSPARTPATAPTKVYMSKIVVILIPLY